MNHSGVGLYRIFKPVQPTLAALALVSGMIVTIASRDMEN
jgi:hypothetical protein